MTTPAERFSRTAAGYAATMAPALLPVNQVVVRRAALVAGERVLDVGTGTGTAAGLARGDGRDVVGVDAAEGMLEIARSRLPDVRFEAMDFAALGFDDGSFDVVLGVHALHFAADRVEALAEWRRVVTPGGRLSLSVPGPRDATPNAFYAEVYERHGIQLVDRSISPEDLQAAGETAGWTDVNVERDPETALLLPDESTFRVWREIGFRGAATDHLTAADQERLTDALLAATPRTEAGAFRVPFGTIYLTARSPMS